jgi:hypothetical protein
MTSRNTFWPASRENSKTFKIAKTERDKRAYRIQVYPHRLSPLWFFPSVGLRDFQNGYLFLVSRNTPDLSACCTSEAMLIPKVAQILNERSFPHMPHF